jgi:CheY-like chemotaxis protein
VTGRNTVLLIEDTRDLRDAFKMSLESSFDVVAVESGEEALAILQKRKSPLIVLTDFQLTGVSGAEFLKQAIENYPELLIGVVFMSGNATFADHYLRLKPQFQALQVPFFALEKPFDTRVLLRSMDQIIEAQ